MTWLSEAILDETENRKLPDTQSNGETESMMNTIQPGSAVEKYLAFLHAGGSDYSLNILKKAGVDLNTPWPVQVTLEKFSRKLNELKKLL